MTDDYLDKEVWNGGIYTTRYNFNMGPESMTRKVILDPCCGPRYMWFDKKHPCVVFGDIRSEKKGFSKYKRHLEIQPDIVMDFRDIPFPDESFKLVVFDPPHIVANDASSCIRQQYGVLSPKTWRKDLKQGFDECWRVLEEFGVLIFKWNDNNKSYEEVLKIIGKTPLFHNTLGRKYTTYWACFMKLPNVYNQQTILEE